MPERGWGAVPRMALAASAGLALVSIAFALSRTGGWGGPPALWSGIVAIVTSAGYLLAGTRASRLERLAIVLITALSLFAIKVLRDPFTFTFADELVHEHNARTIAQSGRLFEGNVILPVTPLYPGLGAVTAAISSTSGLSIFVSGLLVIGIARAVLTSALFMFFEALTRSPLVAGIATLAYAGAPNYMFFTAQYAYESLALPLMTVLLLAMVREASTSRVPLTHGWTLFGLLVALVVPATHHITSYIAISLVIAFAIAAWPRRAHVGGRLWLVALIITLATVGWLVTVASKTVTYLSPVFGGAFRAAVSTVRATVSADAQETAGVRTMFSHVSPTFVTPWGQRLVAIGALVLVLVALPFAVRTFWRYYRSNWMMAVPLLMSFLYLVSAGLRLVPAAWEVGARASEFLFIGVALAFALVGVHRWAPMGRVAFGRAAVAASVAVLVCGGFVAGWPAGFRQAQTYRIEAGDSAIDPPVWSAARWVQRVLGPKNRFAAEESTARVLQTHGQVAFAGSNPPILRILHTGFLQRWHLRALRDLGIGYIVIDRRAFSQLNAAPAIVEHRFHGYFFRSSDASGDDPPAITKFRSIADPIYDSGDIIIFELERR